MKKLLFIGLLGFLLEPLAYSRTVEATVNSIRPGLITVCLWGSDRENDFKVNSWTYLEGVHSLADLNTGDQVAIDYQGKGHPKTAASITKETPAIKLTEL